MPVVEPLFKNDKPHFHKNGGELAVGYEIWTYYAGTNTPVAMYSDPSGNTVYSNPITLNSRGEPDGQGIYANVAHKYKVVLKDAIGSVIWSLDDVAPMGVGDITVEGITAVDHDETLTGDGTTESPLGAVLPTIPMVVFYDDDSRSSSSFSGITFNALDTAVKAHKMVFIVKKAANVGQILLYLQLSDTEGGEASSDDPLINDPLIYRFRNERTGIMYTATQTVGPATGLTWTYSHD